jgi:site-specific recombinase XerC
VKAGASQSLLKKLLLHIRCIFKHARKRKIMVENPTEDLRAESKQRVCERYLSVHECRRLLSVLVGRDRLIVRMFIQLGLRPEEMFALRRDDVQGDQLRIDEALVEGQSAYQDAGIRRLCVHPARPRIGTEGVVGAIRGGTDGLALSDRAWPPRFPERE